METDYCTIFSMDDRQLSFRLKIAKPRKIIYLDKNLKKTLCFIRLNYILNFFVDDKKINIE